MIPGLPRPAEPVVARRPLGRGWTLGALFAFVFIVVPFIVVFIADGVDPSAFECAVRVGERLGETQNGRLEFLLVDTLDGRSPSREFVAAIDHGYTEGVVRSAGEGRPGGSQDFPEVPADSVFSLVGTTMTPDIFYGEQYLFFDRPQVYVSQVKAALLWPSQIHRIEELYLSPLVAVLSVYWVGALPFAEEYSLASWLLMMARFVLLCGAVAAALILRKKRHRWMPGLVWVVGIYVLVAVALAVPSL